MKKRIIQSSCVVFILFLLLISGYSSEAVSAKAISLPIIMYHQINPDLEASNPYTITPDILRGDLQYIKDNGYTTIKLEDLVNYANGEGSLPSKPILITFDDGYESFAEYGLPLFEEYEMNMVLSVVGSYIDVYTQTEDHNLSYSFFSWPALAELQQSPSVELSSHTFHMHSNQVRQGCTMLEGESLEDYSTAFNEDLATVEARFNQYFGYSPIAFAYPFGLNCKEASAILSQRGYQITFTTDQKINLLTGDPSELLNLGRFNRAPSIDRDYFFRALAG